MTFIRMIGLYISISLYLKFKKTRYLNLVLGWGFWVITGILPILSEFLIENEVALSQFLLVLNVTLASLGFFLVISGILVYFTQMMQETHVIFILLILGLGPFLLWWILGPVIAIQITANSMILLYLLIVSIGIKERKEIAKFVGHSIPILYGVTIYILIYLLTYFFVLIPRGEVTYGLYTSSDLFSIVIQYFFGVGITLLLLLLIIQIEQGIAYTDKFVLKDRYSHDLGNLIQVILTTTELVEIQSSMSSSENELIRESCLAAGKLIAEIRRLK
jgi:hypothetical protein